MYANNQYNTTSTAGYNYLFLGPGWGTDGRSELLHLGNLSSTQCSVPLHPRGAIYGTIGTRTPAGPLLCGGRPYTAECYQLSQSEGSWSWVKMPSMNKKRYRATGVVLGNGEWWVTGRNLPNWINVNKQETLQKQRIKPCFNINMFTRGTVKCFLCLYICKQVFDKQY